MRHKATRNSETLFFEVTNQFKKYLRIFVRFNFLEFGANVKQSRLRTQKFIKRERETLKMVKHAEANTRNLENSLSISKHFGRDLLKCRGLMVEKYFNLVDLVRSFPTIGVDTAETEPLKVWR